MIWLKGGVEVWFGEKVRKSVFLAGRNCFLCFSGLKRVLFRAK